MKVALINPVFSVSHGGRERFSVNFARALCADGHETHIFAQRMEDLPEEAVMHPIPGFSGPGWWRFLGFQRAVRGALLSCGPFDVVYGLTRFFPLDIFRLGDGAHRLALERHYPSLWRRWPAMLVNPFHLINLTLEKRLFAEDGCRFVVANSAMIRDYVVQRMGVRPERAAVVYNGVDHACFAPEKAAPLREETRRSLGLRDGDVALLCVAHDWRRKGVSTLMEALPSLPETVHAVVVGRGNPARFMKRAGELGVAERMHFMPPAKEVLRYYAAADMLVLPTRYDPFANVCLEAMACALPVVTSSSNGAAELLRNGVNGWVQRRADDAVELAGIVRSFLALSREERMRMGVCARETALEHTLERNLREMMELMRTVARERKERLSC
ncbi:MAG: glycosyltransferase family 4 protein [Deltaproteobacteria bacterium]|nr:glycosyltransferase family 4 protein [Deltaproteobacteria bacterium]